MSLRSRRKNKQLMPRGQYTILISSLQPHLQESTRTAILSRSLTPAQVAVLSSADLASQARADERDKARKDSLQQTIRQKEDYTGAVQVGRDGVETVGADRAEERHQEEVRRQEVRARVAKEREALVRRESDAAAPAEAQQQMNSPAPAPATQTSDSAVPVDLQPGVMPTSAGAGAASAASSGPGTGHAAPSVPASAAASPHVRRDSSKVPPSPMAPSPSKRAFSLTSAWGGGGETAEPSRATPDTVDVDLGIDQSTLDLSDFMQVGDQVEDDPMGSGEYHVDSGDKQEQGGSVSEKDAYLQRPVVFSRGVSSPFSRLCPQALYFETWLTISSSTQTTAPPRLPFSKLGPYRPLPNGASRSKRNGASSSLARPSNGQAECPAKQARSF